MIIVNQNKTIIANFDNITQIYITSAEDEEIYEIRFETVDSLYETLGKYETEQRAKEVLSEIRGNWETRKDLAYYMPKE